MSIQTRASKRVITSTSNQVTRGRGSVERALDALRTLAPRLSHPGHSRAAVLARLKTPDLASYLIHIHLTVPHGIVIAMHRMAISSAETHVLVEARRPGWQNVTRQRRAFAPRSQRYQSRAPGCTFTLKTTSIETKASIRIDAARRGGQSATLNAKRQGSHQAALQPKQAQDTSDQSCRCRRTARRDKSE